MELKSQVEQLKAGNPMLEESTGLGNLNMDLDLN